MQPGPQTDVHLCEAGVFVSGGSPQSARRLFDATFLRLLQEPGSFCSEVHFLNRVFWKRINSSRKTMTSSELFPMHLTRVRNFHKQISVETRPHDNRPIREE